MASTTMLLPAPVSPVMTVRPGPSGSSTSSMSAKPEMRSRVSMGAGSARVGHGIGARAAMVVDHRPSYPCRSPQDSFCRRIAEERRGRAEHAQRAARPCARRSSRRSAARGPTDRRSVSVTAPARDVLDLQARVGPQDERPVRQRVRADGRQRDGLADPASGWARRPPACTPSSPSASTTMRPSAL